MALSSEPDPRRKGTGCVVALAVVGVVAVVLMVWAYVSVHEWLNPPMPDVRKIATSPDVIAADQAATTHLDDTLTQVRTAVPWISDAGRSADDVCSTNDNIAFIGEQPKWTPVSCSRITAWFGAFDGNLVQQLARINQALGQAGWKPQGTPMNQLYQIDSGRAATASPTPGQPSPIYADGDYANGSQVVHVEVTQLPRAPFSDVSQVAPVATTSVQPGQDGPGTFNREHRSISLASLAQQASHKDDFIIGIETSTQYYSAPIPGPTAPTAASPAGAGGCVTGSYCVGG